MSLRTRTKNGVGAVRLYPADLAIVSLGAVLAYLAITSLPTDSGLRLLAALPLIAFLPGYALVSVLFPTGARPARRSRAASERYPRGIDTLERLSLSFVLSLVVVALVALALAPTRWELAAESVAGALGGVAVALAQVGALRRVRVPEGDRYEVTLRSAIDRVTPTRGNDAVATASSLLLAAGIVAAGVALAVSFAWPTATAGFAELGVYAEDDGELVAGDYPETLAPDESASLVAEIENHGGEERSYTLVVQQQRVVEGTVMERTELERFSETVGADETATIDHRVSPEATGETVRVAYLLYEDEPPVTPTVENADEDVYIWIDVTDEGEGDGA